MSNHRQRPSRNRGPDLFNQGQSSVELALVLPVFALLVLVGSDFGRVFYMSIAISNAARAGAQYGSQSEITSGDSNGMVQAAMTDGSNIPGLSATSSRCTCISTTSVPACPSSYCSANAHATFVQVNTQAPFQTLVNYPGLPSSLTLTGQAIMQVAP